MPAKEVQLSSDDGTTWFTLPGNTGELSSDGDEITDTIFGQTFQSSEAGLINWTVTANGVFKGFAGYLAKLKQQGTSTSMTDEVMSLVSGKTYKVDDATREIWDRATAATFKDDVTPIDVSDIETVNFLFGEVTFVTSFTPAGVVSVSGNFFPTITLAKASSYTLTQTAETKDQTDFTVAQTNNGNRVFIPGLRTVTLELSGFYDPTTDFLTVLTDRGELIVEINPDGSAQSLARGFFRMITRSQSGDVGALEEEVLSLSLNVPETMDFVFGWQHSGTTTLSQSIQIALAAFIDEAVIDVRYLPDGEATGNKSFAGDAVMTDVTLTGELDGMNEFTINAQGSGAITQSSLP